MRFKDRLNGRLLDEFGLVIQTGTELLLFPERKLTCK